MNQSHLTTGKRRGLTSTSSDQGIFTILAFDHRQSFVDMVAPQGKPAGVYDTASSAKIDVVRVLSPVASAVLLDPLYGASQAIARDALPARTGLLVAVERSGYSGASTARISSLLPKWGVEKIKRMGADAVKLLIYYHPDGGEIRDRQEHLAEEVAQRCWDFDIAFFLEAVTYSLDEEHGKDSKAFAEKRPALIARTAKRLSSLAPDVLKIEFPVDANRDQDEGHWLEACQAVSKVSTCPWTVLSAGVDFDLFAREVEVACKGGASGFIGGRAIWKEGVLLPEEERMGWLESVGRDRLQKLSQITSQHARPWTDFYPPQDIGRFRDWYAKY
ncbi:MAG: tagatose 1,6-diphosphate aldolase [Anaerolineales bacterium]